MTPRRRAALLALCSLAALAVLPVAACHSSGFSQDAGAGDGDGSTGDSGPCVCEAQSSTGPVVIACSASGCIDDTTVLCSGAGDLVSLGGTCGDAAPAADGGDAGDGGPCTPQCTGHNCGSPDTCGGVCRCAPGITCNPDQTCGNGCNLVGQQACVVGSGSAASCCSDGYQCQGAGDAGADAGGGAGRCCTVSGSNGSCGQNTDCCDYPAAQCDTFTSTCN